MLAGIELSLRLDFPEQFGVMFLIWSGIGPVFDHSVEVGLGLSVKEKSKFWGVCKAVDF